MKTLMNFGEQLKNQFNINTTLRKCNKFSFSKNVYRLLNKCLSFVPMGEVYDKTQPNYDLKTIFCEE